MMLGFGGTTVKLFGDVIHAPAPVDGAEATRRILSLRYESGLTVVGALLTMKPCYASCA